MAVPWEEADMRAWVAGPQTAGRKCLSVARSGVGGRGRDLASRLEVRLFRMAQAINVDFCC